MSKILIDEATVKLALEAAETLTRYDVVRSNIFLQFHPTATGDYVNLQEFREKAKPVIAALREALAAQPAPAPGYCKNCKDYTVAEQLAPVQETVAWPIETNKQVEALAKQCGWDNRRHMTPADYQIWCDRMREFVQLAAPQAQQEPAARLVRWGETMFSPEGYTINLLDDTLIDGTLFYTTAQAQPAREWVGLTEEEKTELRRKHYPLPLLLMDATEAKLKEKNHD